MAPRQRVGFGPLALLLCCFFSTARRWPGSRLLGLLFSHARPSVSFSSFFSPLFSSATSSKRPALRSPKLRGARKWARELHWSSALAATLKRRQIGRSKFNSLQWKREKRKEKNQKRKGKRVEKSERGKGDCVTSKMGAQCDAHFGCLISPFGPQFLLVFRPFSLSDSSGRFWARFSLFSFRLSPQLGRQFARFFLLLARNVSRKRHGPEAAFYKQPLFIRANRAEELRERISWWN